MDGTPSPRSRKRKGVLIGLSIFFVLLVSVSGGGYWYVASILQASLPRLQGDFQVNGLHGIVRIQRDEQGVPTIHGTSWADLAFGLGVCHGQDRFFQMDLLRRKAAGELSALVGPAALMLDKDSRLHRFRSRMRHAWETMPAADRASIEAYVQGVRWGSTQGLKQSGATPLEYLLLRCDPQPWQPEDCLLAVCAMYQALQTSQIATEKLRADIAAAFSPEVDRFLDPEGTLWDAPIDGSKVAVSAVPSADQLDFRRTPVPVALERAAAADRLDPVIGSNNWAVAGSHSVHGGALLADDMHLQLQLPNIWYRAALVWRDKQGNPRRACGVTLPGGPALVAGSNGQVAWGFTNTEGAWLDLMRLEVHSDDPNRYRTPDGWQPFKVYQEEIQVKDSTPLTFEVKETLWGPVSEHDRQHRPYALRWVAHQPGAVNIKLAQMLETNTLEEALALAPQCGVPHQNLVCVDRSGRIAWTIIGKMPRRVGPVKRAAAPALQQGRWEGFLDAAEYPRLVNPEKGRLWTANNRVVGGAMWDKIGNGGVDAGLRAGQIRDRLLEKDRFAEADLLAIQLDDEARSFRRWQLLFLRIVPTASDAFPRRAELARLVAEWDGHARGDSVGYRVLEQFRREVRANIYEPFREEMRKKALFTGAGIGVGHQQQEEGPLWAMASTQPPHLLSPRFATWNELFLDAVDRTARGLQAGGLPLEQATWGQVNSTQVRHPLSQAVPLLARWLDIPSAPLPGARFDLPRVSSPGHGASERFVVSPGKEEQGIFHMPGGQSGHPLSAYYRDGHSAWEQGQPTPFLPGPPIHELILHP
jgi:penicillin amidase